MKSFSILVILTFFIATNPFPQANNQQQVMAYYESSSFKSVIHLHYNHHFKQSSQFSNFQNIMNQLYSANQDFLDVLYTDCDEDKQLSLYACEIMSKTKDNRYITGSIPSNDFKRLGKKLIQSPPLSRVLQRTQETFTYKILEQFVDKLVPNFFRIINNKQEYEEFLLPHYSPKMILFMREDQQIPLTLKKLAVAFTLRFDFAIITDLNQQLISEFEVKKYPKLAVIKYNFEQQKPEVNYYQHNDYSSDGYYDLKTFFEQFALEEPRNDIVYHKIFMETSARIESAQTAGQLEELKQRLHGWSIIAKHPDQIPQTLFDLKSKYDRYFSYIHYRVEAAPNQELSIYYPSQDTTFPFKGDMDFNSLNAEDFKSNMTVFMHKDFVVLGVRQSYSYICGIVEKPMFVDNCRCLIIADDEAHIMEEAMNIDFDIGFIVRLQKNEKSQERESQGLKISSKDYATVYRDLEYATRMKMKELLDEFIKNPIKEVEAGNPSLAQACFHPTKKCFLLFVNLGKKDRTLQAYTKQVAINYLDGFIFYEVDIDSNPQLAEQLGIKDKKADIVVYNPRTQQYSRLGKKVTKGLIDKFLHANLKNDKRLRWTKIGDVSALNISRRQADGDEPNQEL